MFSAFRVVVVLAMACMLGPVTPTWAAGPPAWFLEPPKDTADAWWAGGEGPDPEAARRTALRAVAARLRSAVSGQISDVVTDSNGRVNRNSLSSVSEEILKTEFTRFEITKTAKGGVGVFVLVKVDRPAFIADTRNQLQVLAKPLAEAEAALPGQSTLDQFLALRRLKTQLDKALGLSLLLQGAGADAEGRAGVLRYGSLAETGRELAGKLSFEVRAAPADADVAAAVTSFLADQGMRSAAGPTAGANVLTVQSQSRQDELFGSKLLKLKVRVAVLDDQGRAAGSREYEAPGSSQYDFRGAREDAIKKLTEMMRKAGPVAALGIKE